MERKYLTTTATSSTETLPDWTKPFVPHDYMASGFLVDDDIARCCESIPRGVSVTFFMDCCHSGTATRFFIAGESLKQDDARPRFMKATKEMVKIHQAARRQRGLTRKSAYKSTSEILFSACRSNEVAWESNGQGDFTKNSLAVLSEADGRPITCKQFADAVSQRFQAKRRQTPEMCCDAALEETTLLGRRGCGRHRHHVHRM